MWAALPIEFIDAAYLIGSVLFTLIFLEIYPY
jgi:hypothetical protein